MGITIEKSNTVNYPVYFLVCYLLVYSVSILIGIMIDIFNSGQTTLLDDDCNTEWYVICLSSSPRIDTKETKMEQAIYFR